MKSFRLKSISLSSAIAVAVGLIGAATALAQGFVPMNMPSKNYNEGRSNTAANSIAVVGYDATTTNGDQVTGLWFWQTDQSIECPLPLGQSGTVAGLASTGLDVYGAGWSNGAGHQAMVWHSDGTGASAAILENYDPPWTVQSWATGTSVGHSVVSGAVYGDMPGVGLTRQAAVWYDGGPGTLLPLPAETAYSEAWDVSGNGNVIVGCKAIKEQGVQIDTPMLPPSADLETAGVIWISSGYTVVDPNAAGPEARSLAFTGVSDDGGIALAAISTTRSNSKGGHYALDTGDLTLLDGGDINGDGLIDLADEHDSAAYALANGGEVVGGSITLPGGSEQAALWIRNASGEFEFHDAAAYLINLGATGMDGWALHAVTGVSADGTLISGWGTDPQGFSGIWGATIPEPSSIALLASGFLILRRKR